MKSLDLALFGAAVASFAASYLRPAQAARRWLLAALVLGGRGVGGGGVGGGEVILAVATAVEWTRIDGRLRQWST